MNRFEKYIASWIIKKVVREGYAHSHFEPFIKLLTDRLQDYYREDNIPTVREYVVDAVDKALSYSPPEQQVKTVHVHAADVESTFIPSFAYSRRAGKPMINAQSYNDAIHDFMRLNPKHRFIFVDENNKVLQAKP